MAETTPRISAIVGRSRELSAVRDVLDLVSADHAALVLSGDAGIGKTILWRQAVESAKARGFRVFQCRGGPSETTLTYAGLADLMTEVDAHEIERLPPPQSRALEVAILRADADGPAPDQRAVSAAFLTLISNAAAEVPLVLAVDDTQWLDAPTARVLAFALRRTRSQRIGLVATVRTTNEPFSLPFELDRSLPPDRIAHERLGPLSLAEIHHMLRDRLGRTFPRPTLLRIAQASGGNPFYSIEIALAVLEPGGAVPAGTSLPLPETLRGLLSDRIGRIPETTRRILVVAAAMSAPTTATLLAAVGPGGIRALDRSELSGVVERDGETIRFAHPLLATAIYAGATSQERTRAHRRLAETAFDPEERARHLAAVARGPDGPTADALIRAARRAEARGAPETAAELAELAANLTAEAPTRALRRFEAAGYFRKAEDPQMARALLESSIAEFASWDDRARALQVIAQMAWEMGSPAEAVALAERALAEAGDDRRLLASIHASVAYVSDPDHEKANAHARAALELLDRRNDPPDLICLVLKAYAESEVCSGHGIPFDLMDIAIDAARSRPPPLVVDRPEVVMAQWLTWTDDFEGARTGLHEGLALAGESGDEGSHAAIVSNLAIVELESGNWDAAAALAREQFMLAEQSGAPRRRALAHFRLGHLATCLGDEATARAQFREALAIAEREGDPAFEEITSTLLGLLEISVGDFEAAVRVLTRSHELSQRAGIMEPGTRRYMGDFAEALIATGELTRAEEVLDVLEARGRANDRPWAQAVAFRCRALLAVARGEMDEAADRIEDALTQIRRTTMPLELGRTLLVQGQIERRRKHKRAAKDALDAALEIFARIGATLWTEKARSELGRIGLRPTAPSELTSTERRVAELAAAGMTNRQIGESAFLTPKSVEGVLIRIYRKLGIRSRAELGAWVAAGDHATA
jgi:predicted ATPase/DNA-binding CsgD family transcriptional regulator